MTCSTGCHLPPLVTVCYRRWVTAKAAGTTATTPAMIVTTTEWAAR
jgi:hypothetical protein